VVYSLKKALQELDDVANLITNLDDKIKNKKIKNMMPDFFLDEKQSIENKNFEKNKEIIKENQSLKEKILAVEKLLQMEKEKNEYIIGKNANLQNKNQELIEILTKVSEYMGIVIEGIEEKI
jgi:hypothetical protein